MSQFFDDARATTDSLDVKRMFDIMEDYAEKHTHEECQRFWAWIIDYLKSDLENPEQVG